MDSIIERDITIITMYFVYLPVNHLELTSASRFTAGSLLIRTTKRKIMHAETKIIRRMQEV
jgi:hypothetical protein